MTLWLSINSKASHSRAPKHSLSAPCTVCKDGWNCKRRITDLLCDFAALGAMGGYLKNLLFICSQNRLRSPTAEQTFASWPNVETASAGLNNDADSPVTPELLGWSDIIFVMEKTHRSKLNGKFRAHLAGKRVICLDIPDDYDYMDPGLVRLLLATVPRFL